MLSEKIIQKSLEHANSRYYYEVSEKLHRVNNKKSYINRRSDSYCCGYMDCQNELRFIPVEEKLPPIDVPVILKFKDWQGNEMFQIYTLGSVERREHFLKTHLKFTEWRFFL